MAPNEPPEIHLQPWPPKIFVRGKDAIRAIAPAMRFFFYCTAIGRIIVPLAGALLWMLR